MLHLVTILSGVPLTVLENKTPVTMNSPFWMILGAVIALLLLFYLAVSISKPEKF